MSTPIDSLAPDSARPPVSAPGERPSPPPPDPPSGRRSWAVRALELGRDAWLMLGMTLLLFVAVELLYRGQGAVRRGVRAVLHPAPETAPLHPYAGQAWWPRWQRDVVGRVRDASYDPYRAFWGRPGMLPLAGIDAEGRRVTTQPAAPADAPQVLLLGGSAMWGYTARDSFTIPSQLASRLAAHRAAPARLVNLAQPSYNVTQNVITLLLELRRGTRPSVVVFLDGNNDVAAAFEAGEPGHVLNEGLAAARWERGGRGSIGQLVSAATQHSLLVQRLLDATSPPRLAQPPVEATCGQLVAQYVTLARQVQALGHEFGFTPIFVWQPMRATSGKRLTAWERSIVPPSARYDEMMRVCTRQAEAAMVAQPGFVSLRSLFDGDTTSVFIDDFGHVTERADGVIAEALEPLVAAHLSPPAR